MTKKLYYVTAYLTRCIKNTNQQNQGRNMITGYKTAHILKRTKQNETRPICSWTRIFLRTDNGKRNNRQNIAFFTLFPRYYLLLFFSLLLFLHPTKSHKPASCWTYFVNDVLI